MMGMASTISLRRDVILMGTRAQMLRGDTRILHLVETFAGKADRVRSRRLAGQLGQQRRHGGTVGAAAEKRADRGGAVDGVPGRFPQQHRNRRFECVDRVGPIVVVGKVPVEAPFDDTASEGDAFSGLQLLHRTVNGSRTRDHMAVEIVEDGLSAEVPLDGRMRNDAFRIGGEDELAGWIGVAHRPRAHPVDREQAAGAARVDDRDRERTRHLLQTVGAMLSISLGERGSRTALDSQRS